MLPLRYRVVAITSAQRPSWQAAAFRAHGSTKQLTLGDPQRGAGSSLASTRQTHGSSLQYDEKVRQSPSVVHRPAPVPASLVEIVEDDGDVERTDELPDVRGATAPDST